MAEMTNEIYIDKSNSGIIVRDMKTLHVISATIQKRKIKKMFEIINTKMSFSEIWDVLN
ncbi:MAG: hypothetical protein KC589_04560 [Nanoarchaeota archaeon]|nr:hypothetical protein [Nanoarchaeota archaeon]